MKNSQAEATEMSMTTDFRDEYSTERGYSLLEILVVLAIMGLIAAMVAPRLFNQVDRSKQTVAKAQVRALQTSMETLRLDLGRYPTIEEGLQILVTPPSDQQASARWFGPYLEDETVPTDPWGEPYRYALPQTDAAGFQRSPFIFSYGADNQPGGNGMNADIGRVAPS